jgi:hypothetical protein
LQEGRDLLALEGRGLRCRSSGVGGPQTVDSETLLDEAQQDATTARTEYAERLV